jgi:hypothetical protein
MHTILIFYLDLHFRVNMCGMLGVSIITRTRAHSEDEQAQDSFSGSGDGQPSHPQTAEPRTYACRAPHYFAPPSRGHARSRVDASARKREGNLLQIGAIRNGFVAHSHASSAAQLALSLDPNRLNPPLLISQKGTQGACAQEDYEKTDKQHAKQHGPWGGRRRSSRRSKK